MVRITLVRDSRFHGGGVSFTIKDEDVVVGKLGNYDGKLSWDRPVKDFCLSAGTDRKPNTWKDYFRPKNGKEIGISFSTSDGFNLVDFNAAKL